MTRHALSRILILMVVLISLVCFASGQNPGQFQAATDYPAGPPTVASNTGYLFGGIAPLEAHTRDSNGHFLDFDGDGKPDVIVATSCTAYEFPGCPASGYAVVTYLGNGDGTFKPCPQNLQPSCAPPYGIISGGPQTSLRSIAVGDFNGDGKLDVVAASDSSGNSGTMVILLGNGDGTFSTGQTYTLNGIVSQANTITVGDFNGDGKLDIAVGLACYNIPINSCSVGALNIYLGHGDGTFSDPTTYQTVGNGALFPVVGDFNKDGILDVVAGSPYAPGTNSASSLTILLGNGDGTFNQQLYGGQPAKTLPFYGLSGIAAVDLNLDGKLDLALTAQSSVLEVVAGNGDGTFQDTPTAYNTNLGNAITNGSPIIATDLNGDGKPDLIVSGTGGSLGQFNAAQVFLNDGIGNLIPGATYLAGGWQYAPIDVADFNGDGKLDLLMASGCAEDETAGGQLCPDGTLTVLLGTGDGSLRSTRYLPGGNSFGRDWSVASADFNGDGFQDLVFPGCAAGQSCQGDGITLLLSDGSGGYQPPLFFPSTAAQGFYLIVADFNGDGRPDVALFSSCDTYPTCAGEAVSVFVNTGNPDPSQLFSAGVVYESGGSSMSVQSIAIGDFDGKNGPDIAMLHCCTSGGNNLLGVLLNKGDGTFGSPAPSQDAVTTELANSTGSWIAAADFNHDGKADLAIAEYTNNPYAQDPYAGLVQILISNGDGTFTVGNSYSSLGDRGLSGSTLTTGDVNGDGNVDIVIGNVCDQRSNSGNYIYDDINCTRGAIGVLLGDGQGNFQPASGQSANPTVVPDANFSAISLADVNGDGKLDVIASTLTGMYVAFGNGDGTFQLGTTYAALRVDNNVQLAVADLNGDGALDIVQPGNAYQGQLAILYNQPVSHGSIATTTTINAPPITYGNNANVTVSVTSAQGPATGNVSLAVDNGAPVTQPLSNGTTTFSIGGLTGGAHSLSATYAAQGNFLASSANGSLQVNQAQPTVSFTGAPANAPYHSTFSVTATTNASTTATITASGACSVSGNLVTMTSGTGTCNLTATWPPDPNYLGASANQSTVATTASSNTTITSNTPNPSVTGQAVTVKYTVTGSGAPTGNVTVSDGTGDTCTAPVATGTCVLVPTTAGTKSLTATYAGDSNFSPSTSAGVTQTINKASTTTTITYQAPNPSVPGQPVMIKFQVAAVAPGGGTAGGNVMVSDGLGDSCTGTVAQGYCLVSFAAAGSKTTTATYAGDSNFNSSTSAGITHNVIDFALSVSPTSQTIKAGQKAVYTITVSPINGFTGLVKLGCTDYPGNSTCSVSPSSVTITGPKSMSSKITIQTSKITGAATYALVFNGTLGNGVPQAGGILHYVGEYPNLITLIVH